MSSFLSYATLCPRFVYIVRVSFFLETIPSPVVKTIINDESFIIFCNHHNFLISTEISKHKIPNILFRKMTNYKNSELTNNNSRNISSVSINDKTLQAFELFNKVFQNYSPDEVFVSFNGGKDCTVVLDLISQYLKQNDNLRNSVIPVLYIRPKNPFQEIEEFVAQCKKHYKADMIEQEGSIKPVLEAVCAERPKLKVCLMGLRRTDPRGGNLNFMQQTDPGWPPLLRVNPILDWTYEEVWGYIRCNKVAYCSLYDLGYTSLGETTNTEKNKHLRREDPVTGEITYRPAYELLDDAQERDGRC